MHTWIDLAALGKVLLAGLAGGVGLVALFGVALVGLSRHETAARDAALTGGRAGSPAWLAVSTLCLAVVLAGVGLGLYTIVA